MDRPRVGVIGACGAVGRAVVTRLLEHQAGRLRLGGRCADRVERLNVAALRTAEVMSVDVNDPATVAAFCAGCRIVVNCAGPSHLVVDRVARAALDAGADYVDPAGDDPLVARMHDAELARQRRTAVISAGLLPGLSGVLPRWVARGGDSFDRLTVFACVRDYFTPAAAGDYLLSLRDAWGEAGAVWRDGLRVSRALEPLIQVTLPCFAGPMNAYPFLTTEIERVARGLGVAEARSYSVFEDDRFVSRLGEIQRTFAATGDLAGAATELARATDLELFGRVPAQQLVCLLEGRAGGQPFTRAGVVLTTNTYTVTAELTTLAVTGILSGAIPVGVHFAALVLDPDSTMARLRLCRDVSAIDTQAGSAALSCPIEEGAL